MNNGITQAIAELKQAIAELKQAEQNFEYASTEFVDIAIIQLLAAKMKVDIFYSLIKQNKSTEIIPNL